MLSILLLFLIVLWALGLIPVGGIAIPNPVFFVVNGHDITLWNLLTLLVIAWIIGLLPEPFQLIASVVLILWILSIIGILAIAGLSNILLLVVIVGLAYYLFIGITHASYP